MDLLKTFGPLLGSVAPSIATALGGPLAGMATKALSQALLGNEDGSVMVCFNGEIYNFRELTVELKALGHVFRTRCDTEACPPARTTRRPPSGNLESISSTWGLSSTSRIFWRSSSTMAVGVVAARATKCKRVRST